MQIVKTFLHRKESCEHRHALVIERGRKWTQCIFVQYPIRIEKIENKLADEFIPINYSIRAAKKILRDMAIVFYGSRANTPKSIKRVLF